LIRTSVKVFLSLLLILPAAGFGDTPIAQKFKSGDPLPANLFVELAKSVNPAVVNVFTTYLPRGRGYQNDPGRDPLQDFFEQFVGPQRGGPVSPQQSLGSGFIIREDGLIVTNNHVIDKADVIKVQITENTKESFDAKVVGRDAKTDIALIKIDATTLSLAAGNNTG
jgi:serine protease Do